MPHFDTHAAFQMLQAHGLSAEQADGITTALVAALDATGQTVATKADLDLLRNATKTDLDLLRTAMKADLDALRLATTADLDAVRTALQTDLGLLRTATKADLDLTQTTLRSETRELRVLMESRFQTVEARFTFTHWMIGLTFTALLGFSLGNLWLLINLLGRLPKP